MPESYDDLVRRLMESERRYAELASLARESSDPQVAKLLDDHAGETGMRKWHRKHFGEPPAEPEQL